MHVAGIQRDLSPTDFDLGLTITGVDADNIYTFLSDFYKIKGSKIQVWRGFYNDNYILTTTSLRFTGVITSYNINEEPDFTMIENAHSITFMCQNFKSVLETKYSGRFTNPNSWKRYYPTDTSMDRVPAMELTTFDFGKTSSNSGSGTFKSSSLNNTTVTSVRSQ